MRRFFSLLFFLIFIVNVNADDILRNLHRRKSFTIDISPKAAFGNAFFLNPNVTADPNAARYFWCPSYFYGARLGFTYINFWPRNVFFTAYYERLFSTFTQKYQLMDYTTQTNYEHSYNLNTGDNAFVFRVTTFSEGDGSAFYIEIGKQVSTVRKVSEHNSISNTDFNLNDPLYKPSQLFNTHYKNLIFGIGAHGLMYSIGLRFTYGLDGLTIGNFQPVDDGHYNNTVINTDYTKFYSNNKESHLFMVQLVFELNLYVFEVGNATCGKKRVFPFPMHLNQDIIW